MPRTERTCRYCGYEDPVRTLALVPATARRQRTLRLAMFVALIWVLLALVYVWVVVRPRRSAARVPAAAASALEQRANSPP